MTEELASISLPIEVFKPTDEAIGVFLLDIFGQEHAYHIIAALAEHIITDASSYDDIAQHYYQTIISKFPELPTQREHLQRELITQLERANAMVEHVRLLSFPGYKDNLSLLNPIVFASINPITRLNLLLANGRVDERFKFELLRQEALILTSLAYTETRIAKRVRAQLIDLNEHFEQSLFEGKYAQTFPQELYSIHDNATNRTVAVTDNMLEGLYMQEPQTHIKKHTNRVRKVAGIGDVLVHFREKDSNSALIKAIYMGILSDSKRIVPESVLDSSGFMFVTDKEEQANLLFTLKRVILQKYPQAQFKENHTIEKNRGQSSHVRFMRLHVQLFPESENTIELIIFNHQDYCNYRYHAGDIDNFSGKVITTNAAAHDLYKLRRTYQVADLLFPPEIYQYDATEVQEFRTQHEQTIIQKLLATKRFVPQVEHPR